MDRTLSRSGEENNSVTKQLHITHKTKHFPRVSCGWGFLGMLPKSKQFAKCTI